MPGFVKHSSVTSVSSDTLDEEENLTGGKTYQTAPYDVEYHHPKLGQVAVAMTGDALPKVTSWKVNHSSDVAVKFYISETLEVSIHAEREIKMKHRALSNDLNLTTSTSNDLNLTANTSNILNPTICASNDLNLNASTAKFCAFAPAPVDDISELIVDLQDSYSGNETCGNKEVSDKEVGQPVDELNFKNSNMPQFRTMEEFFSDLEVRFQEIVVGGLDAKLRASVGEKLLNGEVLLPVENRNVIHAINTAYALQYGSKEKPHPKACGRMADILKSKFPATYKVKQVVSTDFGTFELTKSKGEGGSCDLKKRIGDNFYNKNMRPSINRPTINTDNSSGLGVSTAKKRKRLYALDSDKWYNSSRVQKSVINEQQKLFNGIKAENNNEDNLQIMQLCRAFIQSKFEASEPSQLVEDLDHFWEAGPKLLNNWCQWITNEGDESEDLSSSVSSRMSKIFYFVEQYLLSKKGQAYEVELTEVKVSAERRNGNDGFYKIFLLRELAKQLRNSPEQVVFIDWTDEKSLRAGDHEANLLITRKDTLCTSEFEEKISVSVRIGEKIVFKDVSLPVAFAALIQIYYVCNVNYPSKADDVFQFIQRMLCQVGPAEGAKNERNQVKKWYKDFEVISGTTSKT